MSNKLPGDTDAAGPWPILLAERVWTAYTALDALLLPPHRRQGERGAFTQPPWLEGSTSAWGQAGLRRDGSEQAEDLTGLGLSWLEIRIGEPRVGLCLFPPPLM